ncbi:DUF6520 family protein [Zhouia spongiae]|uniref:DUF6520 family protein n=1 Tax=Zhouia spongiae TaxID=2202721 RepID=A0ABY3YLB6_9FLAO|nr:DUF6520 family protein [Zhouia spongiae]UNY98617.1 DUF6520 family protein [Zhouia spongiae]
MKKMKFILPVGAFILAAGMAFASATFSEPALTGKFIQLEGECRAVPEAECNDLGQTCTYQSQTVYAMKVSATECSVERKHQP